MYHLKDDSRFEPIYQAAMARPGYLVRKRPSATPGGADYSDGIACLQGCGFEHVRFLNITNCFVACLVYLKMDKVSWKI
jgi:hypothetical protein